MSKSLDFAEAIAHLEKSDATMRRLIRQIGVCALEPKGRRSPFESLVRAVAHQQLHANAAARILERFCALFPGKKFPLPADLAAIDDQALRSAGFSGAKSAALRDIAQKTLEGIVPDSRKIRRLEDEDIIERLTAVRGVGRWTAEMLLIFQLGRLDVLPVDDFGVRTGFRLTYELEEMPKPKALLAHGETWRPFRTVAAWYLWRAADQPKKLKA